MRIFFQSIWALIMIYKTILEKEESYKMHSIGQTKEGKTTQFFKLKINHNKTIICNKRK